MKKYTRLLLKGTNWALAGLITLLGFNAASCAEDAPAEYGSPHATFHVKGKVTNTKGEPIPDVEVTAKNEWIMESYGSAIGKTNEAGEYTVTAPITGQEDFRVVYKDVDGETNGSYKNDSVFVDKKDVILTGGKSWYNGSGEIEINVELKEEDN